MAYYPESAHGTQFDAEAVCMVSNCDTNITLFDYDVYAALLYEGASIPIYRWRQMRHGQFWGESIKSLILSFNIQKCEFGAQV